jgi:DNA polymerase-3 subunit alpha
MLANGESVGVFQLEGTGMRDLMRKMRPDHINDLVALVALYRPGPMDSIPKYIACKRGREAPEYLHPALEPILKETFGVMTYQEDVMRIARELAGYTMGQADFLRRAMGKKIASEMAKHRELFVKGAGDRGILPSIAVQIFVHAAKFAGYGFNKGHAAAYAQVAYQTAFLKANYPVEFLAASMTLDIGNTDRLNIFRQEALRLGIRVSPPDINRSETAFTCNAETRDMLYALGAIKGVGRAAMDHVVEERRTGGPFRSISDFARRVDPRFINKRGFEGLVRAGAFDALHANRHQLVRSAEFLLSDSARVARERESGQIALFGEGGGEEEEIRLAPVAEWLPHEKLSEEFNAVGFYLSGHPLDWYDAALKRLGAVTFAKLCEDRRRAGFRALIAGTIIKKQERRGRSEQRYAFVSMSDPTGLFEVMVFSEVLAATRQFLEPGKSVLMAVGVDWVDDELKLRALSATDLDKAAADAGEGMKIYLDDIAPLNAIAGQLRTPGKGIVTLVVPAADGHEVEIRLAQQLQVNAILRGAIKSLPGVLSVEAV